MPRGGARPGAGRKKQDRPIDGNVARKIKAKIDAEKKWHRIVEVETELMETTGKTGPLRTTLIYLDNRDLGNTMDTVNHLHDKPIDMNVTLSLGEGMRLAMQKADERLRNLKR